MLHTNLHDLIDASGTESHIKEARNSLRAALSGGHLTLTSEYQGQLRAMLRQLDEIELDLLHTVTARRVLMERNPHLILEPASDSPI